MLSRQTEKHHIPVPIVVEDLRAYPLQTVEGLWREIRSWRRCRRVGDGVVDVLGESARSHGSSRTYCGR
jgi:hypothetical protein